MSATLARIQGLIRQEAGQSTVEYALIVGLVSVVLAGSLALSAPGWLGSIIDATTGAITAALA